MTNASGNTGGILVFELPSPPVQGGEATRVFNNMIVANNEPNFAPKGTIVGKIPTGTGLMIMANDDIEAFGNTIKDNSSFGVLIVNYYFVDLYIAKPTYDPVPEKIYIHNNTMSNNSHDPHGDAALVGSVLGSSVDIFYNSSGVRTDAGLLGEFPDGLTEYQAICVVDNAPGSSLGRFNISLILGGLPYDPDVSTDPAYFNCQHASLPPIPLDLPIDPNNPDNPPVDTAALCGAEGADINADACIADCPNLSDYRLFADSSNPMGNPNGGGG